MTQEDKELLLRDLIARLPYGVICNDNRHGSGRVTYIDITPDDIEHKNGKVVIYYFDFDECGELKNCKPYLRPMSSMTEEEHTDFFNYHYNIGLEEIKKSGNYLKAAYLNDSAKFDWLNKHHFDYRYLIERGLAIAVTEENNPYED